MGLGGYLTWTAAIREISETLDENTKIVPCEMHGNTVTRIVKSPVFNNNPYIYDDEVDRDKKKFFLPMNLHETNYCKQDTPTKAYQRGDKHIIKQICEHYNISSPKLKCEMYFTEEETGKVSDIVSRLPENYVVIEPHSKESYTPNRKYPFDKWQTVVDSLKGVVNFVQVGRPGYGVLNNVTSLLGTTSFRESAIVIQKSKLFVSTEGGLGHVANAVGTRSLIVLTGYQTYDMVAYPDNINIDISTHGPCGLKIHCNQCERDREMHNEGEIIYNIKKALGVL